VGLSGGLSGERHEEAKKLGERATMMRDDESRTVLRRKGNVSSRALAVLPFVHFVAASLAFTPRLIHSSNQEPRLLMWLSHIRVLPRLSLTGARHQLSITRSSRCCVVVVGSTTSTTSTMQALLSSVSSILWPTSRDLALDSERRLLNNVRAQHRIYDVDIGATEQGEAQLVHTIEIAPTSGSTTSVTTDDNTGAIVAATTVSTSDDSTTIVTTRRHSVTTTTVPHHHEPTTSTESSSSSAATDASATTTTTSTSTSNSTATSIKGPTPVLLLHGFASGSAVWHGCFDALSALRRRVYAIDFIGAGLSSRPSYSAFGVEAAENHHISCIEKWRVQQGLDRVILVGHSFGGYMAAAYAIKHPERVEKLVLVSPVGVPRRPPEADEILNHPDWKVRSMVRFMRHMFSSGFTPQGLIRGAGPLGPRLIRSYVVRRFQEGTVDKETLAEYMYHVCASSGSSEYALSQVLDASIYARAPLVDRMNQVRCPTTFMYGDHDWMDYRAAIEAATTMEAVPADVRIVRHAGHYLFVDNAAEFNEALVETIEEEPDMNARTSWPQFAADFTTERLSSEEGRPRFGR